MSETAQVETPITAFSEHLMVLEDVEDDTGTISHLNHEGDTKYSWNRKNQAECDAARDHFNSLLAKGFLAFKVTRLGCKGVVSLLGEMAARHSAGLEPIPFQVEFSDETEDPQQYWLVIRPFETLVQFARRAELDVELGPIEGVPLTQEERGDALTGEIIHRFIEERMRDSLQSLVGQPMNQSSREAIEENLTRVMQEELNALTSPQEEETPISLVESDDGDVVRINHSQDDDSDALPEEVDTRFRLIANLVAAFRNMGIQCHVSQRGRDTILCFQNSSYIRLLRNRDGELWFALRLTDLTP